MPQALLSAAAVPLSTGLRYVSTTRWRRVLVWDTQQAREVSRL